MNSGSRESNLVPAKTENAYTVNAFYGEKEECKM